ncbi:MAG: tetratricopeptide repeat protein [Planctomycetes bacterium]|nr:tetratricopeptide repeat protein [Planctomycetota bacterium]
MLQAGPESPVSAPRRPLWHTVVFVSICVLLAYLPAALGAGFLSTFDDNFFFGPDNPEFREGLGAVLDPGRTIANVYLPVAHGSLWLDYWLGGGAPLLPHLMSLLWHIGAVVVFVRFALACGVASAPAHLAGALFALHPALAESVAWVSSRKDLTAGVFVFAALWAARVHALRPRAALLVLMALLQVVAMYCKATAVVTPLLAACLVATAGTAPRRWLAPLVLLLVTVPTALHHQAIAAAQGTLAAAPVADRLAQAPGALLHYLSTTLWPTQLNVLYPEVQTLERFRNALPLASAVLAALTALVTFCLWRTRWRPVGVAVLCFVVALLPFNTAYPASSIAAADRYLYLAVPFAALGASMALWRWLPRPFALGVGAALVVVLAIAAGRRAMVFGDDERLWSDSLAVENDNAVAHLNLVGAWQRRGPTELRALRDHLEQAARAARYPVHALRAEQLLSRVAVLDGDYAGAAQHARAAIAAAQKLVDGETAPARQQQARGLLVAAQLAAIEPLQLAHDKAEANACYEAAKALVPDHPEVIAFGAMRELEQVLAGLQAGAADGGPLRLAADDPRLLATVQRLEQAQAASPQSASVCCALAEWYRAADRALPALRSYRQAIAAQPDRTEGWLGAARLLRERDQYAEAEDYARRGLDQHEDPALRQELALALVGQGRLDDAINQLEAYLKVAPDDHDAAKVLANVLVVQAYARLGKQEATHEQVLAMVERALALNPKEMKAHLVLGRVRREQRRFADAVRHLEEAHRLLPTFDEATEMLVQSLVDLGYDHRLRGDDEAAAAAWLRCRELSPASVEGTAIGMQLQAIWRKFEQRGIERLGAGDVPGAIADFRLCLRIDPAQRWAAWLLAQALYRQPDSDLAELQQLCAQAVEWQQEHQLDRSQQVYLMAMVQARAGEGAKARQTAADYLAAPDADARDNVLDALRKIAAQ